MFQLIAWGLIAVAVVAGYMSWRGSIYDEGATKQRENDQVVVGEITKQRDDANTREKARELELGNLRQACQAQSAAVDAVAAVGATVKSGTADINRKHAAESASTKAAIAELQVVVSALPKGDRNAQCDNADAISSRTLIRLRGDTTADRGNDNANGADKRPGPGPVPGPGPGPAAVAAPGR